MKSNASFSDFIDDLKQKLDIVQVISKYISLQHRGSNFWACCPFHGEKTPSFSVKQDGQFYHCFGCGETGDIIKFICKYENVDFMTAVNILAKQAGMELPSFEGNDDIKRKKEQRDRLLNILKDTSEFYINNWQKEQSQDYKNYVIKRRFTKKIMSVFKIGASLDYFALSQYLIKKGYQKADLELSGVLKQNDEGVFMDNMGKRLVFPIMNGFGDVVGFTGRDITNTKSAKYKNTTQTPLFNKSLLIYGLHNLRELKKANNLKQIILVEGNVDVISCFTAGFENTVACMGTAITASHARELHKLCDDVVLCLDSDGAGQHATFKGIEILKQEGLNIRVVTLIGAKDPDEYIQKFGSAAFKKAIDESINGVDFILKQIKQKYDLSKNEEKNAYINETLATIKTLATPAEQEIYLSVVRDEVKLPIEVLKKSFDINVESTSNYSNKVEEEKQASLHGSLVRAKVFILSAIIFKKQYIEGQALDNELFFEEDDYKKCLAYVLERKKDGRDYSATSVINEFDIEKNSLLYDVINFEFIGDNQTQKNYYVESVALLKTYALKMQREDIIKQIGQSATDDEKMELLKKLQEVDAKIKKGQ